MMNPEIKKMWTDALRSGEYVQGKEALRTTNNTYCCLGVLCELAVKNNVIPVPSNPLDGGPVYYVDSDSYLPAPVSEWAGLNEYNPNVTQYGESRPLSAINDEGTPFTDIANLIEEQL